MRISILLSWKSFLAGLALLAVMLVALVYGTEYYTSQSEFCGGACHAMKRQYTNWQHSAHEDVACIDCHFSEGGGPGPGERAWFKQKFPGIGQLASYFADPGAPVRKRVTVSDETCTASGCHADGEYQTNKIQYAENVFFVHKTHPENPIEGQELHCNTCHLHTNRDQHFSVPKEMCFLCHFKGTQFNQGRSKCALCHEVPTKSLQSQVSADSPDQEPITHQSLERAGVACKSCHYELVSGHGELKVEGCLTCHDDRSVLGEINKKLMHEKHVAAQQADCFDCHRTVRHQHIEFLDPARLNCQACHRDHHSFQKILLVGAQKGDVPETPSPMNSVNTNCLGCHVKEEHKKGESLLTGSGQACIDCHTESQGELLEDWKKTVAEELDYARELEAEAVRAMTAAQDRAPVATREEARAKFKEARENMHIVEFGNGVHNKKYSMLLLDAAITNFEDLIDSLGEGG